MTRRDPRPADDMVEIEQARDQAACERQARRQKINEVARQRIDRRRKMIGAVFGWRRTSWS